MKRYVTDTRDTCWRDCIAEMLEIRPSKVPDFVKLYKGKYMDKTREWLRENFGKGIVFTSAGAFMELHEMRNNEAIGPAGYSIMSLEMADYFGARHVAIAYDGRLVYDNGDSREADYKYVVGYFVLYDLEPERGKWLRKKFSSNNKKQTDTVKVVTKRKK